MRTANAPPTLLVWTWGKSDAEIEQAIADLPLARFSRGCAYFLASGSMLRTVG